MTEDGKILVVDDDLDLAEVVKRALELKGWNVAVAENGEEALNMLKKEVPDLILLDMRMPVMNGWQFAHHFRNDYGHFPPIVVMTAAEDSKVRAGEIGAEGYIGKPFELGELYQIVEDMIGAK